MTVTDTNDNIIPALCYICDDMNARPATADYIEQIARPAEEYGFPKEYVKMIRGFGPANDVGNGSNGGADRRDIAPVNI